jgi:hypothetical protein
MSTFYLFQTPDERLAHLNDWAARDYANFKLVDMLAGDTQSHARKRAEALGLAADSAATQAELDHARSALYRSAIEAAFVKNDIDAALTLHDRAEDALVPNDATALEPLVSAGRERQIGRDYAAGLAGIAARSLPELDQAHLAATARNEADWPDDAAQQAANQHFIDVRFGKAKRDVMKFKAAVNSSVAQWLNTRSPSGGRQTDRPPLTLWVHLTPEERQVVDAMLLRNAADVDEAGGGAVARREVPDRLILSPPARKPVELPGPRNPYQRFYERPELREPPVGPSILDPGFEDEQRRRRRPPIEIDAPEDSSHEIA